MTSTEPTQPDPARWISPLQLDAQQAAAISDAVAAVDGVAGLSGGEFGQVGSTLVDGSVTGVRVDDEQVQVHIVADYGIPLQGTANSIGAAVAPWLAGRALQVSVDDILLPGEQLAPPAPPATPASPAPPAPPASPAPPAEQT